jgi:hypothetical protein
MPYWCRVSLASSEQLKEVWLQTSLPMKEEKEAEKEVIGAPVEMLLTRVMSARRVSLRVAGGCRPAEWMSISVWDLRRMMQACSSLSRVCRCSGR